MKRTIVTYLPLVLLSCTADTAPLDGASCPCVSGFECCEPGMFCAPAGTCPSSSGIDFSFTPAEGPALGGNVLTITSTPTLDRLLIGGQRCELTTTSDRKSTCVVPRAREARTVVDVVGAVGDSTATLPGAYRYVWPRMTNALPHSGLISTTAGLHLEVLDADGDGDMDVYFSRASASQGGLQFYENVGGLRFADRTDDWGVITELHTGVTAADFTGDGRTDMLLAPKDSEVRGGAAPIKLMINRDGTFEPEDQRATGDKEWRVLLPFDVDGDNDVDALGCRVVDTGETMPAADIIGALINDAGSFEHAAITDGPYHLDEERGCERLAAGDYDNDGDPDLAAAGYGWVSLFENRGGRFKDVSVASGVARDRGLNRNVTTLQFADFDSDGDLDLVVVYEDDRGTIVLENENGQFARATNLDADTSRLECGRPGDDIDPEFSLLAGFEKSLFIDTNHDGHLDAFVDAPFRGDCPSGPILYENTGRVTFRPWRVPEMNFQEFLTSIAASDFDGDGDLDIIGHRWGPANLRYYLLQRNHARDRTPENRRYISVRALTDADGDATDPTTSDDRDDPSVTVWVDLDGPEDAPDFMAGPGKLLVRTIGGDSTTGSGGPPRAHFGLGSRSAPVYVRVAFADGTQVDERVDIFDREVVIRDR